MNKTLRQSGLVLGTFEADADGDAGAAFQRAVAIDARLEQHQAARAGVLRDPNLIDAAERQAALAKLAAAEHERLTEDAVFLAGARARAAAWRQEMLEGSPGDDASAAHRAELRRQFGALAEGKRADVLTKALDRRSPRDLGLLRALVADELTNEGLAGTLAAYRAPIERLVLELADPDGYAAWHKTTAQLDEFASAQALALRYVSEEPHLTPHERERRAADEAAAKGFIFNDRT
jgi:hypothetical protein